MESLTNEDIIDSEKITISSPAKDETTVFT